MLIDGPGGTGVTRDSVPRISRATTSIRPVSVPGRSLGSGDGLDRAGIPGSPHPYEAERDPAQAAQGRGSAAASRASRPIRAQSPAATASLGTIQEPPTQATFGSAR